MTRRLASHARQSIYGGGAPIEEITMAEIPVQRRGGGPWWLWLILGILAVGLLLWLFSGDRGIPPATTGSLAPAGQVQALAALPAAEPAARS
jgi:hypothetical protein